MATKAEMYQREQRIIALMSEGKTTAEIAKIMSGEFKVSERAIRFQISAVIDGLKEENKSQKAELRAKLMLRQDLIFKKALENDKLKVALDSTAAQAKIAGLYESEKEEEKQPIRWLGLREVDHSKPLELIKDDKAENE